MARFRPTGLLCGLLLGLALPCMSPHDPIAEADQPKGLPPRVASVLRWLPEDTETLIVARSVTVPDLVEAPDWQDVGMILASQGLILDRQNPFRRLQIRLVPSLKDVKEIPTGRKGLVVVAAVGNVLHFRIFDWDGKLIVDTDEKKMPEQARQIDEFRKQLTGMWPPHCPNTAEESSIIFGVTSIVDQAQFKPLRGRKVECIVHGGMNYESVSKFGSLRSESCTIVVFETDLGDAAREWTESLRKGASSIRTLVGREVFVYPSPTARDSWSHELSWEGAYYVLLDPNTLLCASSDRYLESVLRRVDKTPEARALPDNLPEWKQVEFDAPAWMLRHVPKPAEKARIAGMTASFTRKGFRAVYIPRTGFVINVEGLKQSWLLDALLRRDLLKIERQPDGTVVLSCGGKLGDDAFWFAWQVYLLQAFELVHDDR